MCNMRIGGNNENNNCTSCEIGYTLKPDFNNLLNCQIKCEYFYYYTNYNQYKCTRSNTCPDNYNLFIKEKGKCINNCSLDDTYKYQYSGECLSQCPPNTNDNKKEYFCQDIDENLCSLSQRNLIISNDNITEEDIKSFAKIYSDEFSYTDNHISSFQYSNYEIVFYKNKKCISDLSLEVPIVDLEGCYEKVKEIYSIEKNLVYAIVSKIINGISYPKIESFSLFDPEGGQQLEINDLCEDDSIIVQEDLSTKIGDESKYSLIQYLTDQNIDVFNTTHDFYTDICFHFDSPIDKDITLKDRVALFFPNITLCENGCAIKAINLTSMRAKCECKLNNLINSNILSNNAWYQSQVGQIQELISQTNIIIITCIKEFFNINMQCLL